MSKANFVILFLAAGIVIAIIGSWWLDNPRSLKPFEQSESSDHASLSTWQPPQKTPWAKGVRWELEFELPMQSEGLVDVCFSPDGSSLIVVCENDVCQIWSLDSRRLVAELPYNSDSAYRIIFSPDNTKMITQGPPTRVWEWPNPELLHSFDFDGGFYLDGRLMLIEDPPRVRFGTGPAIDPNYWDAETMKEIPRGFAEYAVGERNIPRKRNGVRQRAPNGKQFFEWRYNYVGHGTVDTIGPFIQIYDAGDRTLLAKLDAKGALRAVAWSPDSRRIAIGSSDGIPRIWRMIEKTRESELPQYESRAFSNDLAESD